MARRRKRRLKKSIKLFMALIVLVLVAVAVYLLIPEEKVKNKVQLEAGIETLDIASFMIDGNTKGEFVTDISKINLTEVGKHTIKIKIDKKTYSSTLELIDTTSPSVTGKNVEVALNTKITTDDFIEEIIDCSDTTCSFVTAPDTSIKGDYEVKLLITDEFQNKTEITTNLYVGDVKKTVKIEIGTSKLLIRDFLFDTSLEGKILTDVSNMDFNDFNQYNVEIEVGGINYTSRVIVVDTIAPIGEPSGNIACLNTDVPAEHFVKNIKDSSKVTVNYASAVKFNKLGALKFDIILADEFGNSTSMTIETEVVKDTEAPMINGVHDQTVYDGESITYKKDITVVDNSGENIKLEIDNSKLDIKTLGKYEILYSATDSAGNTTTKTAIFTVAEKPTNYVSPEIVDEMADEILADILTEDMTQYDKAKKIYNWVRDNVKYVNESDKTDWVQAAYYAMKNKKGDCFNYYAISQELLTRAGIENMKIEKSDTSHSMHFWNLVNVGEGWYHFDTTPRRTGGVFFMWTDAKLEEYSAKNKNSHVWDKTKYPATPEK